MTAKEKQKQFINTYLKPTLKQFGYRTSGQTWWKDKGDFFNVINLQNYSWNSKDNVDFRFNIGIALKAMVKDEQKKKVTYNDLTTLTDEGEFIPDRKNRRFGNNQGYSITEETDITEFTLALQQDFEKYILPGLEEPQNLMDCIKVYESTPVWGAYLVRVINENKLIQSDGS